MPPKHSSSKHSQSRRLYRSQTQHLAGGVASGLAGYLGLDPSIIRLVFILMAIFGGSGIMIYLILWLVIPSQSDRGNNYVDKNAAEIKHKATSMARSFSKSTNNAHKIGGIVLIGLGLMFLSNNFGFFTWLRFDKLWPLVIVALGVSVLLKRDNI